MHRTNLNQYKIYLLGIGFLQKEGFLFLFYIE